MSHTHFYSQCQTLSSLRVNRNACVLLHSPITWIVAGLMRLNFVDLGHTGLLSRSVGHPGTVTTLIITIVWSPYLDGHTCGHISLAVHVTDACSTSHQHGFTVLTISPVSQIYWKLLKTGHHLLILGKVLM